MKYTSKKHIIEAFQFTGFGIDVPDWFMDAHHDGRIRFTNNPEEQSITVEQGGKKSTAELGWWVCRDKHEDGSEELYVLSDNKFRKRYKK